MVFIVDISTLKITSANSEALHYYSRNEKLTIEFYNINNKIKCTRCNNMEQLFRLSIFPEIDSTYVSGYRKFHFNNATECKSEYCNYDSENLCDVDKEIKTAQPEMTTPYMMTSSIENKYDDLSLNRNYATRNDNSIYDDVVNRK